MDQYWYESMKDVGLLMDKDGEPIVTYGDLWSYIEDYRKAPKQTNIENLGRYIKACKMLKDFEKEHPEVEVFIPLSDPHEHHGTHVRLVFDNYEFEGEPLKLFKEVLSISDGVEIMPSTSGKVLFHVIFQNIWEVTK